MCHSGHFPSLALASLPSLPHPSQDRVLRVAIGVDCDPDRDTYPSRLAWRGVESLPRLLGLAGTRWTLNIRADAQVAQYHGHADYCRTAFDRVWTSMEHAGSELAWHLHYFDRQGRQDVSERNIRENIRIGRAAIGPVPVVHMGWTWQNSLSLRALRDVGITIDYSPVARMRFAGRGGVDSYDWSHFPYRPQTWHGVQMVPSYSSRDRLLRRYFGTERVMMTTATAPFLYRRLLADFFATGQDFFVSYFHADELVSALSGWRRRLYSFEHLRRNLALLRQMAQSRGYRVQFVTISELAAYLRSPIEHSEGSTAVSGA